jgi:hypothetical protein
MNKYRFTGLLYLLLAFVGPLSLLYIPSVLVNGDGMYTHQLVVENLNLFRIGIMSEVLMILIEVILVSMLYIIMKKVNHTLSVVAMLSRFGMVSVMTVNVILHCGVLAVVAGAENNELVHLLLKTSDYGIYIWQFLFGLHLIVLGYMLLKTKVPQALPYIIMIGSFGYILDSIWVLFDINMLSIIVSVLLGVVVIGELWFTFYLLIKSNIKLKEA